MNILFYHYDETCPTMGGIQRTTAIVAEGLKKYGNKSYNIYNYPLRSQYPPNVPRYEYEKSVRMPTLLTVNDLSDFLQKYKIDAIVNQMGTIENTTFRKAIEKSGRKCKLIYVHHTTPRRLWDLSFSGTFRSFKKAENPKSKLKSIIKVLLFPLYRPLIKYYTLNKHSKEYLKIYEESDNFVLLSKYFEDEWKELTGLKNACKLKFIPNARSFDKCISKDDIIKKEKRVLIVARMVEFPKQVLTALKIWESVIKERDLQDWQLDIVGTGPDLDLFKEFAKNHNIPRVTFFGRQDSQKFYERSSIFLMTSIREGWGMTLVEAMQMGVVPVVFDSFASVREIVKNGENGFLIPPFDKKKFSDKVKLLMRDEALRHSMAKNAIDSTERFTKEKIIDKWQELIMG